MSKPETNAKSLSQKIVQLDQQVDWFYGEDFTLDEAAQRYKSAVALAKEIETELTDLQNEIKILSVDFTKD